MIKNTHILIMLLALAGLAAIVFTGCTASAVTPIPVVPTMPAATDTLTPASSATRAPTGTATEPPLPSPSLALTPTFPVSTPKFLGTALPAVEGAISSDSIQRLTLMAQWGRGMIQGAAFAPDGSQYVIGSAFGFAIYNIQQGQAAPTWVPFKTPAPYSGISFSQDGKYLRLIPADADTPEQVLSFPSGQPVTDLTDMPWITTTTRFDPMDETHVDSPDGNKQLKAYANHDENFWDIQYSIREVFDTKTNSRLFTLPDETFYLTYNDRHKPEGCDLNNTSMCGNAFSPIAFLPYEGSFSPSGDTLTILYRAPNYGNYNRYSVLRVYDGRDGKLLDMIGNYSKPVQTFAYEPGGKRLLIAYVDGSIQLWDIQANLPTFGAWHFNDELRFGQFTADGRFLLLDRLDSLEVRSTVDGSLRARFEQVAYGLSPVDPNIVAIADKDNVIKVMELDSGQTVLSIPAHDYKIFSVTFSPDGNYIASSGQDCKVKLWDAHTGQFLHYFEDTRINAYLGIPATEAPSDTGGNSRIFIYYLHFIKGTDQVIGFGSWGTMVSWNVNTGATNYMVNSAPLEFYGGSVDYPSSFSVDTQAGQFTIGDKLFDLQTGKSKGDILSPKTVPDGCSPYGATSTDGRLLFTIGYNDLEGRVCILDAHDYHLIQVLTVVQNADYNFTVAGFSLSPDGKSLLVATMMGTVNLYQITR